MAHIDKLELSTRTFCTLKRSGIESVEDIDNISDSGLLELPHFNRKCLGEVRAKVREYKKGKHYECRFCDGTRAVPYPGEPGFMVCERCGAEWADCRMLVLDDFSG